MKPRILFILHLPPPVYGASLVGRYIQDSKQINRAFDCHFVNLATTKSMAEIGHRRIKRIFTHLSILLNVATKLFTHNYALCYVTLSATGYAFYKDSMVVGLLKLFKRKVVYHLHNKGVCTRGDKWFDNFLYKRVFSNSSVILLSRYLYPDIQKHVIPNRVHYCSNGIPSLDNEGPVSRHEDKPVEILFLSNMIEAKGVLVLLDACQILKDKGYLFTCRFVGAPSDVTEERFYASVSENGLTGCVFYEGEKYGLDKEYCLRHADIDAVTRILRYFSK